MIAELSTALAQTEIMHGYGIAMMAKSMETLETLSNGMVDMLKSSMELSVNPAVGGNIDIYL